MPQAIAVWITTALVSIGVGAATAGIIATAIASIALSVGLSFVAGLFQGSPSLPKPADGKQARRQSIPPRCTGYGQYRFGGYYMLYEEKDGVAYIVVALHDGAITEFIQFFFNDEPISLVGNVVAEGPDGRYADDRVSLFYRMGLATETAYSDIVGDLSPIWTSDHRGDGIASMAIICDKVAAENFGKIYPNQLPQPSAVMKMLKVFDPRDLAQDQSDPDTWEWTENPVLHLIDYITQSHGMDQDYATRILPEVDSWKTAADVCDEAVALKAGGTEPRYRASGIFQHDNDPADVMAMLLSTFDGWLGETGSGAYKVVAGKFYSPTVTIDANHIIGFSVQRSTPDESAVNEITFSYLSREHKYTEVQGQSWRDEEDISARGRTRTRSSSMVWVFSHSQCRRLCKREMYRASSDAKGTAQTDMFGFKALGERYVNLNIPDLPSLGTFVAQISNAQIDMEKRALSFDWVKVDAEIDEWDEDTEEGDPPPDLDEVESTGSDSAIPGSPTELNAADGVGQSVVTWRNPNSFNFSYAKVFRGGAASSFGSAVDVSGPLNGGLGQLMTFTNSGVMPATYRYWVVAYTAAGQASTPTGPDNAVIS